MLKDKKQEHWDKFDGAGSLFAEAQSEGWNPAIDGWYNPYCGIFNRELTSCYWTPVHIITAPQLYGTSENRSIIENALAIPWHFVLRVLPAHSVQTSASPATQDTDNYLAIMQHASGLIGNSKLHFIFIHMPIR